MSNGFVHFLIVALLIQILQWAKIDFITMFALFVSVSTVPISTNRGACESRCPRRHQLLLDGVRLHALVLGDLVKVLVPVRKRELRAVSERREEGVYP